MFTSVDDVSARLAETGYLASPAVATTVFLAARLGKPLLVEGPAGVGKTELANAVARACDARLVRLQCYEGVDESARAVRVEPRQAAAADQRGPGRDLGRGPHGHLR
ncbi:hypothetical protein STENM223S_03372 [Streptomyces tendae]